MKAWFQAALNDNLSFNAQLGAAYNTAPALPTNTTILYADADLLNLRGSYPLEGGFLTLLRFTAGRLPLADFATEVLSHRVDGVFLDLESTAISLNLGAGYTGLVAKGSSTIQLSKSDLNDYENTKFALASPRLIEQAQAALLGIPGQSSSSRPSCSRTCADGAGSRRRGGHLAGVQRNGDLRSQPRRAREHAVFRRGHERRHPGRSLLRLVLLRGDRADAVIQRRRL